MSAKHANICEMFAERLDWPEKGNHSVVDIQMDLFYIANLGDQ